MSDYVLKEEENAMTDFLDEVRNEAENSQYSPGKVSNSATWDFSFLLNQQNLEMENSQSDSRMVSNSTPSNSDHEVFSASKLDDVLDQNNFDENSKHTLKKSLTATGDSNSDQQLTDESDSKVDSVSYQPEVKTEDPMLASSTRKVSAIISALDPKQSQASAEFPRVQDTVYQPYAYETPPPVELISARIQPPVELISAKKICEVSLENASDDVSEHSTSSHTKPTKRIPHYMVATLSAKAKIRPPGIPKPRPEAQEKKRDSLFSYGKPPPFHETLRTPSRSLSQFNRTTHGNGGSIYLREYAGLSEMSKREWRS